MDMKESPVMKAMINDSQDLFNHLNKLFNEVEIEFELSGEVVMTWEDDNDGGQLLKSTHINITEDSYPHNKNIYVSPVKIKVKVK